MEPTQATQNNGESSVPQPPIAQAPETAPVQTAVAEAVPVQPQPENGQAAVEIVEKIPGGYSFTRHILLVVLILLSVVIIASLIYLNGKSIYQYGI